jgi:hypothetical protein
MIRPFNFQRGDKMETQLPGAKNPHPLSDPLFHPLSDDTRYPEMAGAPTDVANNPSKAPIKPTKEGDCDSDNRPMKSDSFAHRS